jgi:hypothetical protein
MSPAFAAANIDAVAGTHKANAQLTRCHGKTSKPTETHPVAVPSDHECRLLAVPVAVLSAPAMPELLFSSAAAAASHRVSGEVFAIVGFHVPGRTTG